MKTYQHAIWLTVLAILLVFVLYNLIHQPVRYEPWVPAKEARGIWLHRFEYCNYTSTHDQDSIRLYITEAINNAADANFNMIIFQVRGNGDAYYTPGLEPWGNLLTGTLGEDPGWDPLQFAIDLAHGRGLELHAWLNTFPAWRGRDMPPLTDPPSPLLVHPDWVVCDSAGNMMPLSDHYVSLTPGNPEVHDYIITVALDIVNRYDIDGIHFDYVRYPEYSERMGYSHDAVSVARFHSREANPLGLNWEDWQREQLTHFVSKMYNAVTASKPWIKMSTAVLGNYSQTGWNAYHAVYQDGRRWAELGKVDFLCPMTYSARNSPVAPFMDRVWEYHALCSMGRYIFTGIGSYRFNTTYELDWNEAKAQIEELRYWKVPGMVFFDAASLNHRWDDLARDEFRTLATVPAMPWKDPVPPNPPEDFIAETNGNALDLTWSPPAISSDGDLVKRYCIYASPVLPIDTGNGYMLRKIVPGSALNSTLNENEGQSHWYYAITAMDDANNESELSHIVCPGGR